MNTKTFEAIEKLKEVELELHRLKNALEMANKALDAQRTWVGLTDEEIDVMVEITDLSGAYYYDDLLALARAIDAKLKEKNT